MNIKALFCCTAFLNVGAAHSFDLKGVVVGAPLDAKQMKAELGIECGAGLPRCSSGFTTLAGISCTPAARINPQGELIEITSFFPSALFEQFSDALKTKWGAPAVVSNVRMKNGVGISIDEIIESWTNAAGDEVVLYRYAGRVGHGYLSLRSRAGIEAATGQDAAQARRAAGDI
jgi:hypothetical protein